MIAVLLGAPGTGKGTQAVLLSLKFGVPKISTGDMVRESIKNGTETGKIAKSIVERGDLVSDNLIVSMVNERISENDCRNGFILDGFPRTIEQAIKLDDLLNDKNSVINYVINIDLLDEEIIKRITNRRICPECGAVYNLLTNPPKNDMFCDRDLTVELIQRDDDREDVIRERLKVYRNKSLPLIEYYNGKNGVINIDGRDSVEDVFNRILLLIEN